MESATISRVIITQIEAIIFEYFAHAIAAKDIIVMKKVPKIKLRI